MSFISLFKDLIFTQPNQVKLAVTSDLSSLSEEERKNILDGYLDDHSQVRLWASLLNGLITQRKTTFLFSQRICGELLRNDERQPRKTINGTDYKAFVHELLKNGIDVLLRESSQSGAQDARGCVMQVIEPTIVARIESLVGKEYLEKQKTATMAFYDDYFKLKEKKQAQRSAKSEAKKTKSRPSSHDDVDVDVPESDSDRDLVTLSREETSHDSFTSPSGKAKEETSGEQYGDQVNQKRQEYYDRLSKQPIWQFLHLEIREILDAKDEKSLKLKKAVRSFVAANPNLPTVTDLDLHGWIDSLLADIFRANDGPMSIGSKFYHVKRDILLEGLARYERPWSI